jgi:AAA15 family ATPase/GTPase
VVKLPFLDMIECRGEYLLSEEDSNKTIFEADHLFYGHQRNLESYFNILGANDKNSEIKFSFNTTSMSTDRLVEIAPAKYNAWAVFHEDNNPYIDVNYSLEWEDTDRVKSLIVLPFSTSMYRIKSTILNKKKRSQFVSLISSNSKTVTEHFNEIVLTPQEEILYESLRIVEPEIERIAPITTQGNRDLRNGGFVVSINKQRVPIGSMGYGIWRMLEITLAMVNIPGGTLLIDEIDTGLHFSVMIDLWKLICKTAEKLDIQVFATTHNSDCWKSLAEVANSDDIASDDITIHRIERGKKASIVFNEQEMAIAADRDIEVR